MKKYLTNMDTRLYGIKNLVSEAIGVLDDWVGIYAEIKRTLQEESITAEEKLENIKRICGVDDD